MMIIDDDVDAKGRLAVQTLIDQSVCRSVHYTVETASTNTLALDEIRQSTWSANACPRLFLADRQTAGRGRHGRRWISTDGVLTFSLVVSANTVAADDRSRRDPRSLLAIAAGVGVARAVEFELAPLRAQLKWPNDVRLGGGKIAGILLETAANKPALVVIGVGLNVSQHPAIESTANASVATDLCEVSQRSLHRHDLLEVVVEGILDAVSDAEKEPAALIDSFRQRCCLTGHPVQFQSAGQTLSGICHGIDEAGQLLVETPAGLKPVASGEASRVRSLK